MYNLVDQPADSLCRGGRFLLWAMRGWRHALECGTCPPVALHRAFAALNARTVLPDFHIAMTLLHRGGGERISFAPVDFPRIVEDEAVLLSLWRGVAADNPGPVRRTLALLSGEETASPISRAMASAVAHLRVAGFDLSRLTLAS